MIIIGYKLVLSKLIELFVRQFLLFRYFDTSILQYSESIFRVNIPSRYSESIFRINIWSSYVYGLTDWP